MMTVATTELRTIFRSLTFSLGSSPDEPLNVALVGKNTLDSVEDVVVDGSDTLKEGRWGGDGCDEDDKLDVGEAGGLGDFASVRACITITSALATSAADMASSRAARKF